MKIWAVVVPFAAVFSHAVMAAPLAPISTTMDRRQDADAAYGVYERQDADAAYGVYERRQDADAAYGIYERQDADAAYGVYEK
ncbi:hypothetical protein MMC14_001895 [Varicellaria rhodocarpa]|nr:hypothetical protein [Varicellaria rhodocarpa]